MLRRPGGERDAAARLEHAAHLGHHHIGARRKHVAELAQHHVERGVRVRQLLGIAFGPGNAFLPGDASILVCDRQQFGREVQGADPGPGPCGGKATTPVPVPTSSSFWPGETPAKRTRWPAEGVVNMAVGENEAHISRCRFFSSANGSCVMVCSRLCTACKRSVPSVQHTLAARTAA